MPARVGVNERRRILLIEHGDPNMHGETVREVDHLGLRRPARLWPEFDKRLETLSVPSARWQGGARIGESTAGATA